MKYSTAALSTTDAVCRSGGRSLPAICASIIRPIQATPTLISSHGRYIRSSRPFRFEFDGKGKLTLEGGDFSFGKADSLRAAYREVRARFWHPAGHAPPRAMFENPQFNTWIDMGWQPTQEKVIAYARDIVAAGTSRAFS